MCADRVAVVLPYRDEAERIAAAVGSVAVALGNAWMSQGVRGSLVLVDDGSQDGSSDVARAAWDGVVGDHPALDVRVLHVRAGSAGGARREGGAWLGRRAGDQATTWLLSTDADCVVGEDWVLGHLAHARRGAVAVAGIVSLIEDADGHAVHPRWSVEYGATLAADGTHPHVHAANLGVRLDVYTAVGGFRALSRAEDIDLWQRLRAAGHPVVADTGCVVATSARRSGRVAHGFAHALATLYGPG